MYCLLVNNVILGYWILDCWYEMSYKATQELQWPKPAKECGNNAHRETNKSVIVLLVGIKPNLQDFL
jgi:hypothetical protein